MVLLQQQLKIQRNTLLPKQNPQTWRLNAQLLATITTAGTMSNNSLKHRDVEKTSKKTALRKGLWFRRYKKALPNVWRN